MNFERSPWEKLNKILIVAALLYLGVWAWKWFGPGEPVARNIGKMRAISFGSTLWELFWVGTAIACAGYLLWRFLCWLFWRKYFGDNPPPDEPM